MSQTLGAYVLIRELGRGGQGTVWLAKDEKLGRQVALKVLNSGPEPGSITDRDLARFRRESEAASRLDHPNICTLLDAGVVDGTPFLAFRYIEGETLVQKIERQANADRESEEPNRAFSKDGVYHIVATFERIARALHSAHEHGLIHRDIKPGNIMVKPDYTEPVILDFGLAREEFDGAVSLTRSGDLIGTPAYMSPEQLMAHRVPLDRRTDIYSLGATLYECLTLRRPFAALTRAELYQQILHTEPSSSGSINDNVPRDLQVVIETAMEKDRDRRYQTALDLAEDLRRFRQFESIRAKPIGRLLRTRRWAQRHPRAATGVAGLILALAVALFMLSRVVKEKRETVSLALVGMSREYQNRNPRLAVGLALKADKNAPSADTLSQLVAALAVEQAIAVFRGHGAWVNSVDLSTDERRVLTASRDGTFCEWNAATGTSIRSVEVPAKNGNGLTRVKWAEFSPQDDLVLTADTDGMTRLWRDGVELPEKRIDTGDPNLIRASFSPKYDDDELILTCGRSLRMWKGTEEVMKPIAFETPHRAVFGPEGDWVLVWSTDAQILSIKGESLAYLSREIGPVSRASLTKDGTRVAFSTPNTVGSWTWRTGETVQYPTRLRAREVYLLENPSGFVSSSPNGTIKVLDGSGREIRHLAGHGLNVRDSKMASHHLLLTGSNDRTARLWDLDQGRSRRCLTPHVELRYLKAEGKKFLTVGRNKVCVWNDLGLPPRTLSTGRATGSAVRTPAGIVFTMDSQGIQRWDPGEESPTRTIPIDDGYSGSDSLQWHDDRLFVRLEGGIRVLDEQLKPITRHVAAGLTSYRVTADGSVLWGSSAGRVRKWRIEGDSDTSWAVFPAGVRGIQSSPGGNRVAVTYGRGGVSMHKSDGGEMFNVASRENIPVTGLEFDASGGRLLLSVRGHHARVLETSTGEELMRVRSASAEIRNAAFLGDGRSIIGAYTDGMVRVFFADRELAREAARERGEITPAEQKRIDEALGK